MIRLGMHFLLILLNKPNLPKSATMGHNSLACCFSDFWKVWRRRYFTTVKCFSYRTLPTLASYSDSFVACCGSVAEQSKIVFIKKNGDGAHDARDNA